MWPVVERGGSWWSDAGSGGTGADLMPTLVTGHQVSGVVGHGSVESHLLEVSTLRQRWSRAWHAHERARGPESSRRDQDRCFSSRLQQMRLRARETNASWGSASRIRCGWSKTLACRLVEDTGLLSPLQPAPAGWPGAEPHLRRQQLPGDVAVQDMRDALPARSARHRPRPWWPLRQQQRFDQGPQAVVHDARPSAHTFPNGRLTPTATPDQGTSTRGVTSSDAPAADRDPRVVRRRGTDVVPATSRRA